MKTTEKSKALQELKDWDQVFRALAHESRRRILTVLNARGGKMSAGEIAGRFSCAWATTTRHLGVLREAGLVEVKKTGREVFYELNHKKLLNVVQDWLRWFDTKG